MRIMLTEWKVEAGWENKTMTDEGRDKRDVRVDGLQR